MRESAFHESKHHGLVSFPYTVYHIKMPDFIVSYPLHFHEEFELVLVTQGALRVKVMDREDTLLSGDVALILPDTAHSLEMGNDGFTEYFNIIFSISMIRGTELFDELYSRYLSAFSEHKRVAECFLKRGSPFNRMITPYLNELIIHRHESYSSRQLLVLGNILLLLDCIYRFSKEAEDKNGYLESMSLIKKALYLVENSYAEDLSIARVAKLCGYSQSHFMKLFRQITGQSFNDYLISYRLMIAAKLLKSSDSKIIDIAQDCGFNDAAYFSTAFLKRFSKSPREYRKKHREQA